VPTPLQTIRAAARSRSTVIVEAYEKDGSREVREIEPYSLRPGRTAERLMFYCLKRDAWRSLLVPNIVRAQETGRTFTPREQIEL
jgi:predicted DNA-binding transcriptional regulator YafY